MGQRRYPVTRLEQDQVRQGAGVLKLGQFAFEVLRHVVKLIERQISNQH